jgi:hypothetical protein
MFIKLYELKNKKCSDPLKKHLQQSYTKGLRKIDIGMCGPYESFLKLTPAQKVCAPCRKCLPICLREQVEQTNENEYNVTDDENYDNRENNKVQEINTSLQIIGGSPIKTPKLAMKRYARTELKKISTRYRS